MPLKGSVCKEKKLEEEEIFGKGGQRMLFKDTTLDAICT